MYDYRYRPHDYVPRLNEYTTGLNGQHAISLFEAARNGNTQLFSVILQDAKDKEIAINDFTGSMCEQYTMEEIISITLNLYLTSCGRLAIDALVGTKVLIEHGADILASIHNYKEPLETAVRYNMLAVVEYMVAKGARPGLEYVKSVEMLQVFLRYGIDIKSPDVTGMTILHMVIGNHASSADITIFALKHGVDIDGVDQWGWTALHRAGQFADAENARVLCDFGANLDILDKKGKTALGNAIESARSPYDRYNGNRPAHANSRLTCKILRDEPSRRYRQALDYMGAVVVDPNPDRSRRGFTSDLDILSLDNKLEIMRYVGMIPNWSHGPL